MKIPDSCNKPFKSAAGAQRQYNTLYRMYTRAFDGGGAFGFDWPTMRSNWPECYERMQFLQQAINAECRKPVAPADGSANG